MSQPRPTRDAPIVAVTVYPDRARVTRRGSPPGLPAGDHRSTSDPLPIGPAPRLRPGGRPRAGHRARRRRGHPPRAAQHRRDRGRAGGAAPRAGRRAGRARSTPTRWRPAGRSSSTSSPSGPAARTPGRWPPGRPTSAAVAAFADSIADQLTAGQARRRELARSAGSSAQDRLAAVERRLAAGRQAPPQPDRLAAAVTLAGPGEADAESSWSCRTWWTAPAGSPRTTCGSTTRRRRSRGSTLTWFGLVTQHTGEDWPECELRLSTARPAGRGRPCRSWTRGTSTGVRPLPVPPARWRGAGPSCRGVRRPRRRRAGRRMARWPPMDAAASWPVVESVGGGRAGGGRGDVPAGPPGRRARPTAARTGRPWRCWSCRSRWTTSPRRSARPRRTCGRPWSTARRTRCCPAGPRSSTAPTSSAPRGLATWAPGEEVELALGVDDRIRVERELTRRTATKATLSATRRRDVEYRITVANHTPGPARVTVLDQVAGLPRRGHHGARDAGRPGPGRAHRAGRADLAAGAGAGRAAGDRPGRCGWSWPGAWR